MKQSSLFAFVALTAACAVATPDVSNVAVTQHAATHVVNVTYDLSEDAIVTVAFLTNDVVCEATSHVNGDTWRAVVAGTGKQIAWNMAADLGSENVANYSVKARVSAWTTDAPPTYYVLDLVSGNRDTTLRRYYEYEGQLPEGIGSDLYRTKKMVFRRIPAAGVSFTMGSPSAEWAASGFAKEPGTDAAMGYETQHTVTFTKDFYLGVFEVTKAQYRQVAGSLPTQSYTGSDADLCPVSNVRTWFEVRCNEGDCGCWPSDGRYPQNTHYLGKLRKMAGGTEVVYPNHTNWRAVTGNGYDLPTEAQWEFACRAGTTTAYNNGKDMSNNTADSALDDIAWYAGTVGSESHVRPVGGKKPNGWGLYDMHGNVREWIIDSVEKYATGDAWYKENRTDPEGITYQGTRGMRGGGYDSNASGCRSAARYTHDWGGVGGGSIGFRVACPVDEL